MAAPRFLAQRESRKSSLQHEKGKQDGEKKRGRGKNTAKDDEAKSRNTYKDTGQKYYDDVLKKAAKGGRSIVQYEEESKKVTDAKVIIKQIPLNHDFIALEHAQQSNLSFSRNIVADGLKILLKKKK